MKKAFVTGGTGFLGINLIAELLRQDWEVTALYRSTSDLKYLKKLDVTLVEGEITEPSSLEDAIPEDMDAIFHVAGDTNRWHRNNARQSTINIDGTRNMIDVAAKKRAKCFIHTSTVSAWGRVKGLVDENTPQKGNISPLNYERTKWYGEREALKGIERGMKVVILNPASIIGPYDKNTWGKSFIALEQGQLPFSPPGENCYSHVSEIAKAHIAAVEKGQNGHRYILAGIHASMYEFLKIIGETMGKKVPPKIPSFLFRTMGNLLSMISDVTQKEPLLTREVTILVSAKDYNFSSDKARRELGFKDVPLELCVKDCYDWMVQEGVLLASS